MKVVAFAASNSRNSINKKLVTYASGLIEGADVEILDLNDFEMPIFSEDREKELGQPDEAKRFYAKLGEADAIIVSFAEHNGSYTAAYKNLFDWTSRIDVKVFQNKPAVYLSASPGPGGAGSVLAAAKGSAPFFGVDLKADLSIGRFYDVFDLETGKLSDESLDAELHEAISTLS